MSGWTYDDLPTIKLERKKPYELITKDSMVKVIRKRFEEILYTEISDKRQLSNAGKLIIQAVNDYNQNSGMWTITSGRDD